MHLRIGRVLLASLTEDGLAEHLFDIANQLNRGAELLIDHDEKVKVAAIDLRAGRKAKASAAYASAREYFAAGMALLDEQDWSNEYELTFSLWLERAECELLNGDFDTAGQLIGELIAARRVESRRGRRLPSEGPAPCHEDRKSNRRWTTALTCLRRLGIDMPAHPTEDQVQAEYETLGQALGARSIESLIDLPLMTDPELVAAMQILSDLTAPAYFADQRLFCLAAMPHGEDQPAARHKRRFRIRLSPIWGLCLGLTAFTVTVMAIVSPSLRATWSRSTASSQFGRKFTWRPGWLPPGRGRSRPRSISGRPAFAPRLRPVISPIACLSAYETISHLLLAERPARCGVARIGDRAGVRPKGQVPRRCGHYRKPPALHRHDAGPDRKLLHLQ